MKTYYYALVQTGADLTKPTFIFGWDTKTVEDDAPIPTINCADGLQAVRLDWMTAEQWPPNTGDFQNKALDGNTIVPTEPHFYIPPPVPLAEQAQTAKQAVERQAAMVTAMGEEFGPKMKAYVRALRAIINGSDTTSTELPDMPSDVTE